MSEFYEYGSPGARCLRSSPLSALVGLILVLLGGAAFGAGAIYARTSLIVLTEANHILPFVDYAVFAVVGATGIFAIIAFIICAVSSGWNAKRCFEGSKKAFCGRCLNTTLLICLIFGIIFWTLVAALLTYPVTSMSLLLYRDIGPTRIYSKTTHMDTEVTARPLRVARQIGADSEGQDLVAKLLMLVRVAMNSSKLREARYYDPSETGDEVIRLHQ
nr:unnamed protein product [Spirometra erinaceieuropaei]